MLSYPDGICRLTGESGVVPGHDHVPLVDHRTHDDSVLRERIVREQLLGFGDIVGVIDDDRPAVVGEWPGLVELALLQQAPLVLAMRGSDLLPSRGVLSIRQDCSEERHCTFSFGRTGRDAR